MRRLATAAAAAVLWSAPASADVASVGADAVELHLIRKGQWSPVRCDRIEYALTDYVYCYPSRNKELGVLYGIAVRDGRPVIQPVTGKSKQFMPGSSISAVDGSELPVETWTGTQGTMDELLQRARR